MSAEDRLRLDLARRALVGTGYFTEAEVGDDIAPRITELAAALSHDTDAWAAVFRFALDYARTSGDSPACQCVPCCAYRAVRDVLRHPNACLCGDCYSAAMGGGR